MALSRVHTWASLEELTATDLNAEFNNILNYLNGSSIALTLSSLSVNGHTVTVNGNATLNQDVSTAGSPTLAGLSVSGASLTINTGAAIPLLLQVGQTVSILNNGTANLLTMGADQMVSVVAFAGANGVRADAVFDGTTIRFIGTSTLGAGIALQDGGSGILQVKNTTGGTLANVFFKIS